MSNVFALIKSGKCYIINILLILVFICWFLFSYVFVLL